MAGDRPVVVIDGIRVLRSKEKLHPALSFIRDVLLDRVRPAMPRPQFAIASLSLGSCKYHSLPTKIQVASALGYQGIEIFLPDFEAFVAEVQAGRHQALFPTPPPIFTRDLERACATALAALCNSHNLTIPVIQPLRDFENFSSPAALSRALNSAERWLSLMPYFNTDLLLVCSNLIEGPDPVLSGATTVHAYLDAQVHAFRLLGERAAKYGVRLGYEPLAWGTVINRWEQTWEIVKRVDLPNVGLILDSFNTLGNQYADPSAATALRPLPFSDLTANLAGLACTIPGHKLFFYQIADAHKPGTPLPDRPEAPARMVWSRTSRVFPCEDSEAGGGGAHGSAPEAMGFLPVADMTRAVHATGYAGWWSLEVFNTSLLEEDGGCPWRHGRRGIRGLEKLWSEVGKGEGESKVKSTKLGGRGTRPLLGLIDS